MLTPEQEAEIAARLQDAHNGCCAPDNASYVRHMELLLAERQKLQAFKDWVHGYLDGQGVPHSPPGSHGAAGCRIGDRMDWVFAWIKELESDNAKLVANTKILEETINQQAYDQAEESMGRDLTT